MIHTWDSCPRDHIVDMGAEAMSEGDPQSLIPGIPVGGGYC